jgi:alpha/beta superfamily hydrolase
VVDRLLAALAIVLPPNPSAGGKAKAKL